MSAFSSDYTYMQLSKAYQQDRQKEAQRAHEAHEFLKQHPEKRLIRLPKITIHWN